jgi:hypothetical protein
VVCKATFAVASFLSDVVRISDRAWKVGPNVMPMFDSAEYHRRSLLSSPIAPRQPSISVLVDRWASIVSLTGTKIGVRKY